jgi:hypothetical protein
MKYISFCLLLVFAIGCNHVSYAQKISIAINSGVNYSDIHGQETGGKWRSKPGPLQGLNFEYSINKTFGVQTGINISTVYYEHKPTSYPWIYYPDFRFDIRLDPYYYQSTDFKDFSFLRIPVLFSISVPSAVHFKLRAGLFYSRLTDYNINTNYYSSLGPEKPEKNDFGYIFSSAVAYPLSDNFRATFDFGYLTGRKKFLDNFNYRHGSSEISFGIAYTGFLKSKNVPLNSRQDTDSSSKNVSVTIAGGINYSWITGGKPAEKYSGSAGPEIGFYLNFPIGTGSYFQTGVMFVRKGYSIRDSSSSFYRIAWKGSPMYSVDTKVQADYAVIPALFRFPVVKSGRIFLSTGPWLGLKLNARTVGVAYEEYRSSNSYQTRKTIVYDDLEELVKDYDTGWIFGCTASVPVIKNYNVDLALQFSAGFRNVYKSSSTGADQNSYDNVKILKNRTISLLLEFPIPYAGR